MDKVNNKLINVLLILSIFYLLFLLRDFWLNVIYKIFIIFKPFLLSFTLAYACNPFLRWFSKKGINKGIGIIIIFIFLVLFLYFIVISLIPIFKEQFISMISSTFDFLSTMANKYNLNLDTIYTHLTDILNKFTYSNISFSILNVFNAGVSFISNLIIVIVSWVYFMCYIDDIRLKIKSIFKDKNFYELIEKIDYETTMYFRGLFLTLVIQFFEYTIVFHLIGHPNFLLLGILTSISGLIPYFGGLIVSIIALIIASVISPKVFILTLLVAIIFPNIDSYLITPKIYGKTNNISPLLNIFAIFAGGILGGLLGILIALPVVIILRTIYNYFRKNKFNLKLKV